ncbi:3520_t:CDS:2 [Acaulospora colombiana]|uniref:3520_t:CDS:1 n=1 Tax=Acaulospora colombiana TaxID=27376 RepID=A0ACA9K127_9GLOM|nr:3520_t:CDS:2 [Acaulospora colombiana]
MLLDRILDFKESSGFIIIEDTILQSGRLLLREFVKRATKNDKRNVIFLCIESSPQSILESASIPKKIVILDAYTRLGAYENNDESVSPNVHVIKNLDDISEIAALIQEHIGKGIALVHQYATTTITVKNIEQSNKHSIRGYSEESEKLVNSWMNSLDRGMCAIEHRKRSGKVLYETNIYHTDESTAELVIQHEKNELVNKDVDIPDPTTANLLFNLTLTKEQKKAKDEVILPHVKIQGENA